MSKTHPVSIGPRSLRYVCPNLSKKQAEALSFSLGHAMIEYGINTPDRAAAFIAQVAHESGGFRYKEEIASGVAYEGRRDLGNTHPGDGRRFKGRGYLQITGYTNYKQVHAKLGIDCIQTPALLATEKNASRTAAWWWSEHGCNGFADRGDFVGLTYRINGGVNGLSSRQAYWKRAKLVKRFLVPKER